MSSIPKANEKLIPFLGCTLCYKTKKEFWAKEGSYDERCLALDRSILKVHRALPIGQNKYVTEESFKSLLAYHRLLRRA